MERPVGGYIPVGSNDLCKKTKKELMRKNFNFLVYKLKNVIFIFALTLLTFFYYYSIVILLKNDY